MTGSISLQLCRGNYAVAGRSSSTGLYREEYATFESSGLYDHADATGFIRLFGLPYKLAGQARLEDAEAAGAVPEPAPEPETMTGSDWLD